MDNNEENLSTSMQNSDLNNSVGDSNNKLHKTWNHWSNTLRFMLSDTAIILAPIVTDSLSTLELVDIVEKVIQVKLLPQLKAICNLPHKAFIYLNFTTKGAAEKFMKASLVIKGKKVMYINRSIREDVLSVLIDKIPPDVVREKVPILLKKYGTARNFQPKIIKMNGGFQLETAPVVFEVQLDKEITKEMFPNYIMIDSIKTYLQVRGKPNVCYKCDSPAHIASACSIRFCVNCKKNMNSDHNCTNTYASRLKNSLTKISMLMEEKALEDCRDLPKDNEGNIEILDQSLGLSLISKNFNENDDQNDVAKAQRYDKVETVVLDIGDENEKLDVSTNKDNKDKSEDTLQQSTVKAKRRTRKDKSQSLKKIKKGNDEKEKSYMLRSDFKKQHVKDSQYEMEIEGENRCSTDDESSDFLEEDKTASLT